MLDNTRIWDFLSRNRGVLPVSDMITIVLFNLMARKCIEDDSVIKDANKEDLLKFQRAYYMTNAENFKTEELTAGIRAISSIYNIPEYIFDSFFDVKLGASDWKKAFCDSRDFVNSLEISNDDYPEIANELSAYIIKSASKASADYISSEMLSEAYAVLADVKDNELVADGTIGCAYSLLKCIKDKDVMVWGQDINIYSLQIAAMMLIISNIKDFELIEGDFTGVKLSREFDKIIMSVPLGIKMFSLSKRQEELANKWKCPEKASIDCYYIANALEHMSKNGRCVINVTPSTLFSTGKMVEYRRNLIEHKCVSAAISFPSLYMGTAVRTCILVLENNHEDVLMINGDSLVNKGRRNEVTWRADAISKLEEILNKRVNVPGISYLAYYGDIQNKDFNLTPERYTEVESEIKQRSIEAIDSDLSVYYTRLKELETRKKNLKLFN